MRVCLIAFDNFRPKNVIEHSDKDKKIDAHAQPRDREQYANKSLVDTYVDGGAHKWQANETVLNLQARLACGVDEMSHKPKHKNPIQRFTIT